MRAMHESRYKSCRSGNMYQRRSRFNRHSPAALAWFRLLPISIADVGMAFSVLRIAGAGMAFSLAKDRGLSRSRFNRHSPGFVCSVLRIVDAGMAFSLAKGRGLSRCGMKCPHTDRTPMAVCVLFGFLFSQRPRPVSLWNEVPSH